MTFSSWAPSSWRSGRRGVDGAVVPTASPTPGVPRCGDGVEEPAVVDVLVLVDGVKIVTDAFSASYLKGTELDYVETLQGAGFKFNNPNAKRTCGCGS
jgi:Fe-S cluster assembly iron-binding protein IscA